MSKTNSSKWTRKSSGEGYYVVAKPSGFLAVFRLFRKHKSGTMMVENASLKWLRASGYGDCYFPDRWVAPCTLYDFSKDSEILWLKLSIPYES